MRKVIVFLYFVFLFKLAFAQSLPSLPEFGSSEAPVANNIAAPAANAPATAVLPQNLNHAAAANKLALAGNPEDELVEVRGSGAQEASEPSIEVPEIDDATINAGTPVPSQAPELALPDFSGETAPSADASAPTPTLPEMETPTIAAPAEKSEDEFTAPEIAAPADTGSAVSTEATEVRAEDLAPAPAVAAPVSTSTAAPTEAANGNKIENIITDNSVRNQFPETPDLNFNNDSKQANTGTSNQGPDIKEGEVDKILDEVFNKGKSEEEIARQKEADRAEEEQAKATTLAPEDEEVVDVADMGVKRPLEDLEVSDDEAMALSEIGSPASMKEDNKSPFAPGNNYSASRSIYNSNTYSEQQLSDLLVHSAMKGDRKSVISLIHSGRSPNSQNKFGETPLMGAVYNNQTAIIEILLSEGADANIADSKGNTPLLVAAAKNNLQATQQLIKSGADIDLANNASDTPLLVATLKNNAAVVDSLVRQGANLNKSNADGLTALHIAAYNGNDQLVKYLLSVGANPNIVAKGGFRPYDLAMKRSPTTASTLAAYMQSKQKMASAQNISQQIQARSAAPQAPKRTNSEYKYAMYPTAYVEQDKRENLEQAKAFSAAVQNQPSNWWAAKNNLNTAPVQDMQVTAAAAQEVPASIAYRSAPAQQQAPVNNNQKQWRKLTVDQNELNANEAKAQLQQQQMQYQNYQQAQQKGSYAAANYNYLNPEQPVRQGYGQQQYSAPAAAAPQMPTDVPASIRMQQYKRSYNQQPVQQQPVQQQRYNTQYSASAPAVQQPRVIRQMQPVAAPSYNQQYSAPKNYNYLNGSSNMQSAPAQQYSQAPAGVNIPRYSTLPADKKAVWDIKLAEWVRNGLNLSSQSEGQKQFWAKQKKIFEAVYQEQFNPSVERVKMQIGASRIKAPSYQQQPQQVAKAIPADRGETVVKNVGGAEITVKPIKIGTNNAAPAETAEIEDDVALSSYNYSYIQ